MKLDLDDSIRSALGAMVDTAPDLGPTPIGIDPDDTWTASTPQNRTFRPAMLVAAAICVASGVGAVAVIAWRDGQTEIPATSAPQADPTSDATTRWRDGVAMVVYMRPGAAASSLELVRSVLSESVEIAGPDGVHYLDITESIVEAQRVLADDPASLALLNEANVPTAFYVTPTDTATPNELVGLADSLENLPEVLRVDVDPTGTPVIPIVNLDDPDVTTPAP
jgi:hypothetical protein